MEAVRKQDFTAAEPGPELRERIDLEIREGWAGPWIVTRGRLYDTRELPGFAAQGTGTLLGYLLYRIEGGECEVVVLEALEQGRGVGTALLNRAKKTAEEAACRRLWLITTNDNTSAIRFYQKYGFLLKAVHIGAVDEARRLLKPTLPLTGEDGIPIHHEFEFELLL